MFFRAICYAWLCAIITAAPSLWLYSKSNNEMVGISYCMFGNLGQSEQVKIYRILLFILTYFIPAGIITFHACAISM